MSMITISTTIPEDLHHLAVEKNLKWNECLILGIKTALNQPFALRQGETIDQESYKAKFIASERRERAMEKLLSKIPLKILQEAGTTPDDTPTLSPS
jgi:hypothetical protein